MNALSQLEDQIKERKYHEIVQSLAVSYILYSYHAAPTYAQH